MPDADLQRILDDLCRRREELAKIILKGDENQPRQTEVTPHDAEADSTVSDAPHPEIRTP